MVIVVSMGVVFGLLIGASMLGAAVCLLKWYINLLFISACSSVGDRDLVFSSIPSLFA